MSSAELLTRWFDEVWNKGNEEFIGEMMHRRVIIHGLDTVGTSHGIENFRLFNANFSESFIEIQIAVQTVFENKDQAAAYCIVTGRHQKATRSRLTESVSSGFKTEKLLKDGIITTFSKCINNPDIASCHLKKQEIRNNSPIAGSPRLL